jgi:hypothetical protein
MLFADTATLSCIGNYPGPLIDLNIEHKKLTACSKEKTMNIFVQGLQAKGVVIREYPGQILRAISGYVAFPF